MDGKKQNIAMYDISKNRVITRLFAELKIAMLLEWKKWKDVRDVSKSYFQNYYQIFVFTNPIFSRPFSLSNIKCLSINFSKTKWSIDITKIRKKFPYFAPTGSHLRWLWNVTCKLQFKNIFTPIRSVEIQQISKLDVTNPLWFAIFKSVYTELFTIPRRPYRIAAFTATWWPVHVFHRSELVSFELCATI